MFEEKIYDENLKEYSLYELYSLLTPVIKKICNNYINVISEVQLRKISLKIIKDCVMSFDKNDLSFEKYFEKNMSAYFKNYVARLNKKEIINDYIDDNINIENSYSKALIEIKKLCTFLTKIEYSAKFCKKIVDNPKINSLLSIVVEKNIHLIENDNINMIFDNEIFKTLVNTYCLTSEKYEYNNSDDDIELDISDNNLNTYIKEISKFSLLTKEEEKELFNRYAAGDESAREKLINSNLRLVVNIVKKINYDYNINIFDLIQEGNIGLMKAVENFDASKGYKFSTYAVWWIKASIKNLITKSNIKIPININLQIQKAQTLLRKKLGREPTCEEISNESKISISNVIKALEAQNIVSLNDPIGEDDDELLTIIPSREKSVEEVAEQKILEEEILDFFTKVGLSEKEKIVLKETLGIGTYPKRFCEIGIEYNVTRERIRFIYNKAISKLTKYLNKKNYVIYNEEKDIINNENDLSNKLKECIDDGILNTVEESILKEIYYVDEKEKSTKTIARVIKETSTKYKLPEQQVFETYNSAMNKLNSYINESQKIYKK